MATAPNFKRFAFAAILVTGLALAACTGRSAPPTGQPTATATPTGVPIYLPTDTPGGQAGIAISPASGGPNTPVTILGAGFPAGAHVNIRIGPPNAGASLQPYGVAFADANGAFNILIHAPDAWADGSPISGDRIVIVAATDDFALKATAEFAYQAAGATETPTPQPSASPTSSVCADRVTFVADVTIPDNTRVAPGAPFVKTWRVRNSGTCAWDVSYALVFAGGHSMGAPTVVSLGGVVPPGSTVDLSIGLTAPAASGVYRSDWMLRNGVGVLFGIGDDARRPFWTQIVVGPTPVPITPTPVIANWRGEYYTNRNLSGSSALVRDDASLSFNWGTSSPAQGIPADDFSARWTRTLYFDAAAYRFHALVDDGARVYVDGALILDEWRDGALREVTADVNLAAGNHSLRIEYYEHTGGAVAQVWWEKVVSYPDWKGEYWSNRDLNGAPVFTRNDKSIDFNWGPGTPAQIVPADNFSARWTRTAGFDSGTYRFHALVDDGVRVWVDDILILDGWRDGSSRELTADVALAQGARRLKVEYYERVGDARLSVWWEKLAASYPDWKAELWPNKTFSGGPAVTRNDTAIDFNWSEAAPAPGLPANQFAIRWTRAINFETGVYRLTAQADDGIRVYLDGGLILNEWHASNGDATYTVDAALAGAHALVVEYYEESGAARAKFAWQRLGDLPTLTPTPRPTRTQTPTGTPTATTSPSMTPTASATPSATASPTASATPTATATATTVPLTGVRLNEVLPAPGVVDWDGSGLADAQDEWIELTNTGVITVDIGGWQLQAANGGPSYTMPLGTLIGPGQWVVFYGKATGLALNDDGDGVRLLGPGGQVMDLVILGRLGADRSASRDEGGLWHSDWSPSPGAANLPPGASSASTVNRTHRPKDGPAAR